MLSIRRFFFLSPGSCPRGWTWGYLGAKIKFRPAVCPLCYLLNHWMKFKQNSCVSYSHEWGAQRHFFGPALWGPGGGSRGHISFNFNYKVNFKKVLIPNLACVLTNESYGTYQTGFYPHAFFKKRERDIVIASVRPSVRPYICLLCYLLLNHWTQFKEIWCVSYSYEWGAQRQLF